MLDLARHGLLVTAPRDRLPGESFDSRVATARKFVPFASAVRLLDEEDLQWDSDARRAVDNRSRIAGVAASVMETVRAVESTPTEELRSRLATPLATALDPHQVRNVAVMTVHDGWGTCLFDEQGTGKTVSLIAAFDELAERNEADVLVIVAPKSMVAEWESEFQKFTGGMYRVRLAVGGAGQKRHALSAGADVIVLNYEAVGALLEDLKLVCKRARVVLAVDESYNVKNPMSNRTVALTQLREWCDRTFVLCGTPAPNSAHDLVAQFDLVDFGYTFAGARLSKDRRVAAAEARGVLDERGMYLRNAKQQVLPDLPQRTQTELVVEMAPRQHRLYDDLADALIDDLTQATDRDFELDLANYLARREALLRTCSNPAPLLHGDYDEIPAKLSAIDGLLEDYVEHRGEKVVIWSRYRASIVVLAERFKRYGLVVVDGSVPDVAARREAVRRFQQDPDTMVFVGNPAAAGAGLTLHRARIALYESFSNQAAHFMQSLDRIHRRGQTRPVDYLVLVCADTIEPIEYQTLLAKTRTQSELLGDEADDRITRSALLAELLAPRRQ